MLINLLKQKRYLHYTATSYERAHDWQWKYNENIHEIWIDQREKNGSLNLLENFMIELNMFSLLKNHICKCCLLCK